MNIFLNRYFESTDQPKFKYELLGINNVGTMLSFGVKLPHVRCLHELSRPAQCQIRATPAYAGTAYTQCQNETCNNEQTILFLLMGKSIPLKRKNEKYILLEHMERLNLILQPVVKFWYCNPPPPHAHGCPQSLEQIFIPIIVPCIKSSFHRGQTEILNIFVSPLPTAMWKMKTV